MPNPFRSFCDRVRFWSLFSLEWLAMPTDATATLSQAASPSRRSTAPRRHALLENYFYFLMTLLIFGTVVYGFNRTVDQNLIHPAVPRPFILYVHAAVFSGWLVLFVLQSTLVRTHHVRWHRRVGWFGAGVGALIPVLGVATAITMARFNTFQLHRTGADAFLIIPLWDMVTFTGAFALAVYWRRKSEFHRRLILIACCALTAAAFGRFPPNILPRIVFYAGVDFLILLGVARDLIVNRSIHQVYRYALPVIMVGQVVVMYTSIAKPAVWMRIAHAMLGRGRNGRYANANEWRGDFVQRWNCPTQAKTGLEWATLRNLPENVSAPRRGIS